MTNEQLYMLMRSMLAELDNAIDEVRLLMPADAEQVEYKNFLPGASTFEYRAIEPLNALWQTWNDRTELALGKRQDKD